MKKKLTALLFTATIFLSSVHTFADFDSDTEVLVNGKAIKLDNPVFFDDANHETYLPLRSFLEQNGYIITYDSAEKTIYGTDGKNTFSLTIGSDSFKINKQVYSDTASPSKIKNGITYISDYTASRILNSSSVFIPNENIIDFIRINDNYSYDYTASNYLPDNELNAVNIRLIANLKDFDDNSVIEAKKLIFEYFNSGKYTEDDKTAETQTPEAMKKTQSRKEEYVNKVTDIFKRNNRLIYSETSVKNCIDFLRKYYCPDNNLSELCITLFHISSFFKDKASEELDKIKFDILSCFIDHYKYSETQPDKISDKFNICLDNLKNFAKKNNIVLFDYSEYINILNELFVSVQENPEASDKITPNTSFYTYAETPFNNLELTSQKQFDEYVRQIRIYLEDMKSYVVSKKTPALDKTEYTSCERELSNIYMRLEQAFQNNLIKGKSEYKTLSSEISEYIKLISRNNQRLNTQEKINDAVEKLKKYTEKLKQLAEKNKINI